MPKENDLEGPQDQGGKHGGQKGMPSRRRSQAMGEGKMVTDHRARSRNADVA